MKFPTQVGKHSPPFQNAACNNKVDPEQFFAQHSCRVTRTGVIKSVFKSKRPWDRKLERRCLWTLPSRSATVSR
jgi:hypothetical protein